jgi:hypothetical protein
LAYLENSPVLHPAVSLQTLTLKAQLDPSNALALPQIGSNSGETSEGNKANKANDVGEVVHSND